MVVGTCQDKRAFGQDLGSVALPEELIDRTDAELGQEREESTRLRRRLVHSDFSRPCTLPATVAG